MDLFKTLAVLSLAMAAAAYAFWVFYLRDAPDRGAPAIARMSGTMQRDVPATSARDAPPVCVERPSRSGLELHVSADYLEAVGSTHEPALRVRDLGSSDDVLVVAAGAPPVRHNWPAHVHGKRPLHVVHCVFTWRASVADFRDQRSFLETNPGSSLRVCCVHDEDVRRMLSHDHIEFSFQPQVLARFQRASRTAPRQAALLAALAHLATGPDDQPMLALVGGGVRCMRPVGGAYDLLVVRDSPSLDMSHLSPRVVGSSGSAAAREFLRWLICDSGNLGDLGAALNAFAGREPGTPFVRGFTSMAPCRPRVTSPLQVLVLELAQTREVLDATGECVLRFDAP